MYAGLIGLNTNVSGSDREKGERVRESRERQVLTKHTEMWDQILGRSSQIDISEI